MKKAVLMFILLSAAVFAQDVISKNNITLLALTENASGEFGSVAILDLELRPGSERVYLETFPMTKVTTQASLRFAQQIACKELEIDCSHYDFLFTIRALPGIVGGPSAGGAATLLVAASLLDKSIPTELAMTGTINSGGLIGPVGGLKQKVEAAASNSIKTVLLPKGTKNFKEGNVTIDLIDYGKSLNLTVREVSTIGEVFELALGIPQKVFNESLQMEERYQNIMRDVADDLCKRNKGLSEKANVSSAKNFSERAEQEFNSEAYYSSASYCFRSNVEYKREWYRIANFSQEELSKKIAVLKHDAEKVGREVEARNISTITDLQTFMAVMERVDEVLLQVVELSQKIEKNDTTAGSDLAYAEERMFSAVTWARFFDGQDKHVVINRDRLKASCAAKISEAEERYNYVKSVIPDALDATRKDIDLAYVNLGKGRYIMCLYGASKAKAEADVLLGLMGVEESRFDEVIDLKLQVARQALVKAQRKQIFPIIAFSYYEYANSLRAFDRVSALLFAEYSLELANLDIYFGAPTAPISSKPKIEGVILGLVFILGMLLGALITFVVWRSAFAKSIQTLQTPPKRRLRGKKR